MKKKTKVDDLADELEKMSTKHKEPVLKSYTMHRTKSPYRWQLATVYSQGDKVLRVEYSENIPGIIKNKLVHEIIKDMDARDKTAK